MGKKRRLSRLLAVVCAVVVSTGCGSAGETKSTDMAREHEPIIMQAPFRNTSAFIDVVHEKYPEIQLEILPYSGKNYTAYVTAQFASGDMPDIYCTTYYVPGREKMDDKLIDLSGYAFTDNYAEARLREVTDGGAIYLLPTYYDCIGITYNKTLLEKNGWELPTSFEELEKLALQVKESGYNLALNQLQLPGYGFQYLCNILDTDYLNTPAGRQWQNDFLSGKATFHDTPQMMESLRVLDKWRDLGMLNGEGDVNNDANTHDIMAQGKTLFMLGSQNVFTEDETTDEFGLMPYLSEDGSKNAFILQVSRYMGLNKHLRDAGNEQKLQDALHVMEVLSTVEGMKALNSTYSNVSLLPLKDYQVNPEGYYADIEKELNAGVTAPFIYSGWENVIVDIGNAMIAYIKGENTLEAVADAFDDNRQFLADNTSASYTVVTEKLDTNDCARLVGICFAQACDADLALISKNKWYKIGQSEDLNMEGVSGALYPLPVTDQELTSILPTGWRENIQTVTLSGARIREIVALGYDRNRDGHTFPYELVMPQKMELDDDTLYTAVICGVTEEIAEEGNLTDTGILGLSAAQEYFSRFPTMSKEDIVW